MPIETRDVTQDQMRRVLESLEGHFLDLKAKEVAPAKLTKLLSAFANADGGELYVGIAEDKAKKSRTWSGFTTIEAAKGHIQALESLFPLGQDFSYVFLTGSTSKANGIVLQILVHKTRDIKKASDGIPYLRRGAQSLPVDTPEKLKRLELDKGLTSFEGDTVATSLETISNSTTIIRFLIDVIPTAEPEPWLRKQRLIVAEKPTVAGVLLFADEPQAELPKRSGVKIYRYATKDAQGTRAALVQDPITVEGSLYAQIRDTVAKTTEIVESLSVLGESGPQAVQYPKEALHEIITNALLHRDYSIADDVHVRIFENRIEVESPGRLPGHVTAANILEERFARNGQLVRLINKFPNPPNKDVGEGLNTAFEAMRQLRLKDPVITEKDNSVLVEIRHEGVDPPEVLVINYLKTHDHITNSIGRELCHIGSENRMKNVFKKLIAQGHIEPVPGLSGNKTAYRAKRK